MTEFQKRKSEGIAVCVIACQQLESCYALTDGKDLHQVAVFNLTRTEVFSLWKFLAF